MKQSEAAVRNDREQNNNKPFTKRVDLRFQMFLPPVPVLTEFYYDAGALSVSHGLSSWGLSLNRCAGGEEFIIPRLIVA